MYDSITLRGILFLYNGLRKHILMEKLNFAKKG